MQGPHKYKSNIIVAILAENMQAELPNNDYVMFIDELKFFRKNTFSNSFPLI